MSAKIATIFLIVCAIEVLHAQWWAGTVRPGPNGSWTWTPAASHGRNRKTRSTTSNTIADGSLIALSSIGRAQFGIKNAVRDAIKRGVPENIALECAKAQQENLQDFADSLSHRVWQISEGVKQEEKLTPVAPQLLSQLEELENLISNTPERINRIIESDSPTALEDAAAVFQAVRDQVTLRVENMWQIVEDHAGQDSEIYSKAQELGKEILFTGFNGANKLIADATKCIKDNSSA